jgi:serine/threonine protein kinase
MGNFVDFSHYGYRLESELGANRQGGRVTYLAEDTDLKQKVVIKQFQFARQSSQWSEYDSIQREISVLRDLKHDGIPRYLNSFQTPDGFCIVQEYKPAQPLSAERSFSPEELKTIIGKILEILVYLQNRIPPVIHRDLKPDNILVDKDLNVYLVDFGFARIGDGEIGVSSVVKGTLGFMPPEQLFNRHLTEASDLYGLGMTLICILTHTKPDDIGQLVDINYKVKFRHLVPKLGTPWFKWLEKLAESRIEDRFSNAKEALKAVPPSPVYPPELQFSHTEVSLQSKHIGQIISFPLEITNLLPEVTMTGTWGIQKHPNDPLTLQGHHPWIVIKPACFEGNTVKCHIIVDTSRLMAGKTYSRKLVLNTNSFPATHFIPLTVRTASVPIRSANISFAPIVLLFAYTLAVFRFLLWMAIPDSLNLELIPKISLGISAGCLFGIQCAAWTLEYSGAVLGARLNSSMAIFLGIPVLVNTWIFLEYLMGSWNSIFVGLILGTLNGWLLGLGVGVAFEKLLGQMLYKQYATSLVLSTSALAIAIACGFAFGFGNAIVLGVMTVCSILLGSLLANAPLNYAKRVADYRKLERNRIRP